MKKYFLALLCCISISAYGQQTQFSEAELVEKLAPASGKVARTRGLRNLSVEATTTDNPAQTQAGQVSLTIAFGFDSAKIQKTSFAQLDTLAKAVNSNELSTYRFLIEGHTDAKGSAQYNKALSQKRADAVKAYLANKSVNSIRMISEGRGFDTLANPQDPLADENRRVLIKTIF